MSGKAMSQGIHMPNVKSLFQTVIKPKNTIITIIIQSMWPWPQDYVQGCTSKLFYCGKAMSQGTHMPKLRALSQTAPKLW